MPKNFDVISRLDELAQSPNAIEAFKKDDISRLGQEAMEEYRIDRESRSEWEENARAAMKAILQEKTDKNYPWPNASNVRVPLLTTAALQFAARAYPAIVQSPKLVRSEIIGRDHDQAKQARAERVETHMSYQLLKEMKGWESDTDTMLHQLPAVGCAFRKTFFNHEERRPDARLVSAMDLVVNQSAVSLETVPRISHRFDLYPHEIQSRVRARTFADIDIRALSPDSEDDGLRRHDRNDQDTQAPHSFVEQHRYVDLDGDGFAEPWVVTIHEGSEQVVRVAANYDLHKATLNSRNELVTLPRYNYFTKYGFIPDPAGGFYDVGFGLLLRTLSDAIDTSLNQMMDSGHLQVAGGGFIGSGLNLKRPELRFSPGVYHTVNAPGNVIKDAIVPFQHAGPSEVLLNLLMALIDFGKQITAVQDILTGETQRAQPATTTLAQIEQGLKVFSAIYKRIYRALGDEYRILYALNARYPDQEKYLKVLDWQPPAIPPQMAGGMPAMPGAQFEGNGAPGAMPPSAAEGLPPGMAQMQPSPAPVPIMVQDYAYDDCDIVPVADPHMVTDMQRLAKAQVLIELGGHPLYGPKINALEGARRILRASNIEELEKIAPEQTGPSPAEQLQMAGMEAEVSDKQASAELKKAQAQKALAEAGTAGTQPGADPNAAIEGEAEAMEKDRRFELDLAKAEREAFENDRDFEAARQDAEREFEASRMDADRDFEASREDALLDRIAEAQGAGREAFESDRQAGIERERNERADYEADRSREDERERSKSDGERQLQIERIKAKSKAAKKPAAK